MQYLDIPNVRELEDLIIEAIYQDVIKGKLDQKRKQLEIEYTMGRDLRPGQIDQMLEVLSAWCVLKFICWYVFSQCLAYSLIHLIFFIKVPNFRGNFKSYRY